MNIFKQISLALFTLCLFHISKIKAIKWHEQKDTHKPSILNNKTNKALIKMEDKVNFESILDPLLVPRVSGSDGNIAVQKHITDHLTELGWDIDTDSFEGETPFGTKPFTNIIATLDPEVPRRLVLACHFDSKSSPEDTFIGAIDSSVPCAQLIHLASVMKPMLDKHKAKDGQLVTLQFIFFDGEEAFVEWSPTDSLYGSMHLAKKWENISYPPDNTEETTELHRMDMIVLLDLLGSNLGGAQVFFDYYKETTTWHNVMYQAERVIKKAKEWKGQSKENIFNYTKIPNYIEDDHVPFLERGIKVLHIIPYRFPGVWHKDEDIKENLDFQAIENLNKVFRFFVARYLHLSV